MEKYPAVKAGTIYSAGWSALASDSQENYLIIKYPFFTPTLSLSTYMNYLKMLVVFLLITLKFIVEWNQVFSIRMKKLIFS